MLQRKQFNRNGYLLAKRLQKLLRAAFLYDTPFYFGAGIHTRRHFAGFSAIRHLSSSCLMSHLIRTWRERSINVIFVHNDIKTRRELSCWGNKDTHKYIAGADQNPHLMYSFWMLKFSSYIFTWSSAINYWVLWQLNAKGILKSKCFIQIME